MTITVTVTALNGEALAADKAWATVPLGLQALATMAMTIPATALMWRRGRRAGFALGSVLGIIGGLLGATSVALASFWLLCLANILIGAAMGCATFYRFAAAEIAEEASRARAISLVVAGGVVAAIAGPTLSRWTVDLVPGHAFAGCYLVMALVYAGILGLLPLPRLARPAALAASTLAPSRSLLAIVRRPTVAVAMFSAMIGYGVMTFLMTATPLAMIYHAHTVEAWTLVIEAHVLAMFGPSFVTGTLIARFGVLNVLWVGALLQLAAVAVDLMGLGLGHFVVGLSLLGVGWNFLYVGGTALLTEGDRPEEQGRIQGVNDFLIFATVAFASLASGVVHSQAGWWVLNFSVLPLIGLSLAAILGLLFARRAGLVPARG
jgi:MFS family permease